MTEKTLKNSTAAGEVVGVTASVKVQSVAAAK